VVFSAIVLLSAILHPDPSFRAHAFALPLLLLHPDLLLGFDVDVDYNYDDDSGDDSGDSGNSSGDESGNEDPSGIAPQSDDAPGERATGDGADGKPVTATENPELAARQTNQILRPWFASAGSSAPPPVLRWTAAASLRSVVALGSCLTATGVATMWRLWVSGSGNANYLYFQSLAFHVLQAALACGFLASAARRLDKTAEGERLAQARRACAARRWARKHRALQGKGKGNN
jgi:hypothetical protein